MSYPRPRELRLIAAVSAVMLAGVALLGLVLEVPLAEARLRPALGFVALLWGLHAVLVALRFRGDQHLLPAAGALAGIGMLLVTRLVPQLSARQLLWMAVGSVALVASAALPWSTALLRRYKYSAAVAGLALVALTLVFGMDPNQSGARLWLGIPGWSFQPSEILKVLLVVFLAAYLDEKRELLASDVSWGPLRLPPVPYLAPMLAMWGISLVLLISQRDLGAGLLFFTVFLVMLYLAIGRTSYVLGGFALLVAGGYVAYELFSHVRLRVDIWLNPWADPLGRSYQVLAALYAVASGGILGSGLGRGYPLYVPAVHTDFAFVALAEEAGLLAALAVLIVYTLLIVRGLVVACDAPDHFRRLLAAGLTAVIGVQAFVILGGNLRLIPLTGVTLPFISYGGSSLLANFLILGILLRISHESYSPSSPPPPVPLSLGGREALPTSLPSPPEGEGQEVRGAAAAERRSRVLLFRFASVSVLAMLLLAGATGYWQVVRGPELARAAGNPRLLEEQWRVQRGRLLDRRGDALAQSQVVQGEGPSPRLSRTYPRPVFAPVTGYYSARLGATALERSQDRYLSGRVGESLLSRIWRDLTHAPRRGLDVVTTVDSRLQEVAEKELGRAQGAVVAIRPRTGEILALVSRPTFDPARIEEDWLQLLQSDARPLYNRATQGLYAPGSTFKVVTAAAALDAGLVTPSTPFSDAGGEVVIEGFRITNPGREGRPSLDFAHALVFSSNVVFAQVGLEVGEARLREYAGRFGIGRALPLEVETSATSLSRAPSMSRPLLASTAFGQGELLISPLQMALVAATVANGGEVPRPYVVKEVRRPQGEVLERRAPSSLGRAVTPETAAILQQLLVLSVEEGFARQAAIRGVRVAGKTGTAQSEPALPDHSWFIGFAPADDPQIAVAVLMEYSGWGSLEAAPLARRVMEEALRLRE